MLGTFLLIIAGIFAVLLVVRLLGGVLGRGAGYPPMGGMPGRGMGAGPGVGPGGYGPGYGGGGGGGFFSGMLGGLGGALAGNWLYDQFSGRHGHSTTSSELYTTEPAPLADDGDAIVGGDDHGGLGESWDDTGGGGNWGDSGDAGGDWGGGGDFGGGGDWGGGGGGGDW